MIRMGSQVWRKLQETILTAAVFMFFMALGGISRVSAQDDAIDETPPSSYPSEVVSDWKAQDGTNYESLITSIKNSLKDKSLAAKITGSGEQGYLNACHWRRVDRLKPYTKWIKKMVYARHHNIGGAIIGYTEDLNGDGRGFGPWGMTTGMSSDYRSGNSGGTAIHMLEFTNYYPKPTTVVDGGRGCVRDPCPTYDGNKLVFAWAEDNNGYHLYDVDLETKKTRQLTFDPEQGLQISDMQPCVTPLGDIIFCSSRCFQHVDCNVNMVSNLYICDKDGKYLRRISYDQVGVFYPTMRDDGTVMYTRWEYNDKNVANVMGIFTMNPDGTRQNEFYGNQTSSPAMFQMARSVPGIGNEMLAVSTLGGHMGPFAGDICLVDASEVRNGTKGVTMICPKGRSVPTGSAMSMDGVPDEKKLFQNPYPLDNTCMLVSYRPTRSAKFNIYWMDFDGKRELLATGGSQSVSEPVSLMKRPVPITTKFFADYTKDKAAVSVVDVYYSGGTGGYINAMQGVAKGTVKKIRVVALEYRTDPPHGNTGQSAYQMTPVGRYGCSWEAKWICGEAEVAPDGSAAFEVPARTPIFLQLIDERGLCVQTMRSWMTLQPGERFDCMGCHEDKNKAPLDKATQLASTAPKPLKPFMDLPQKPGNFYFLTVVQPVLDKYCVKSGCHDASHSKLKLNKNIVDASTLGADEKNAYRKWSTSYYNLSAKSYANYNCIFGGAEGIRPNSIGSPVSGVIKKLLGGHNNAPKEAIEIIAAWIDLGVPHSGTYTDDMPDDVRKSYENRLQRGKKEEAVEAKNIEQFIKDGQYCQEKYNFGGCTNVDKPEKKSEKRVASLTGNLNVRFLPTERMLSLNLPSEGNIKILDILGRQILSKSISRDAFAESAQQNIKLNLPAGTYIVKFDGVKVSAEEMVSIL